MVKVHATLSIDPEAHTLAASRIENLSAFLNDSIYAYCSGNLSDDDRKKIPAEQILTQELMALRKEHAATVQELSDLRASSEAKVLELDAEVGRLRSELSARSDSARQKFRETGPVGRSDKLVELRTELADPATTASRKSELVSEIAQLVRKEAK